jgi:hypothetical protein
MDLSSTRAFGSRATRGLAAALRNIKNSANRGLQFFDVAGFRCLIVLLTLQQVGGNAVSVFR